jgi:hypothetical protein
MADGAAHQGSVRAAEQFAAAHKTLLADRSFQFNLTDPLDSLPPPQTLVWLAKTLNWLAQYLQYIFWGALIVGGLVIAALLAREFIRYRRPAKAATPTLRADAPLWTPDAARARVLLADADRLAAEGHYAEAAHLLLRRSIDEIEDRRPRLIARSFTARDIAKLAQLPENARKAFGLIAAHVEVSLFGERPLDEATWLGCRRAYEDLVFADVWQSAA